MSLFLKKDVFFVKFPIVFPLIYLTILYTLPSFETHLIFITILLLAESHFGATWPFFLDKVNFPHIIKKKIEFIVIPILLTLFCIIGFFYFKNIFLLIFFIANMYHVTRQSYGITNLYVKEPYEKKHYTNIIYAFNILFFFIAYFRFYMPVINNENLLILNFLIILAIIIVFYFEFKKFERPENLCVTPPSPRIRILTNTTKQHASTPSWLVAQDLHAPGPPTRHARTIFCLWARHDPIFCQSHQHGQAQRRNFTGPRLCHGFQW